MIKWRYFFRQLYNRWFLLLNTLQPNPNLTHTHTHARTHATAHIHVHILAQYVARVQRARRQSIDRKTEQCTIQWHTVVLWYAIVVRVIHHAHFIHVHMHFVICVKGICGVCGFQAITATDIIAVTTATSTRNAAAVTAWRLNNRYTNWTGYTQRDTDSEHTQYA